MIKDYRLDKGLVIISSGAAALADQRSLTVSLV
ncbi:MAG: hypothetical protein ACI9W6_000024 [Motiliproteus sp.]|jgi:hypothetical protein